MKIYVAGPDVFRPDSAALAAEARKAVESYGHRALLPADNEASTAEGIFRANLALITECDAVVADLNPFRGDEPDSGTCFEVGCAIALGKRVVGYVGDARPMADRLAEKYGLPVPAEGCRLLDPDGDAIEDFGLPLNLMLSVPCEIVEGRIREALSKIGSAAPGGGIF